MFRYSLEKQHVETTYTKKTSWKQIMVSNDLNELIGIAKTNEGRFLIIDYDDMCKTVFEK